MEFNELIDAFAKRHNVENLVAVDGAAALEAFVNQAETWRRLLADFRPAAKAAAESKAAEKLSFGSSDFMQV